MFSLFRFIVLICGLLLGISLLALNAQGELNIADPTKHDYANPVKGRAGHDYTDAESNSLRVYDFYSRQADYYMAMDSEKWPTRFPAFPGLDGGTHGHWGKYNQNSHKDSRWNEMDTGSVVEGIFHHEKLTVIKGVNIRLGDEGQVSTVFDPLTLGYRNTWHGGFVEIDPQRWGVMRGSIQVGETLFGGSSIMAVGLNGWLGDAQSGAARYKGFYRFDEKVVLNYTLGEAKVLDFPWALSGSQVVTRSIQVDQTLEALRLRLAQVDEQATIQRGEAGEVTIEYQGQVFYAHIKTSNPIEYQLDEGGLWVEFERLPRAETATIYLWTGSPSELMEAQAAVAAHRPIEDLVAMTQGGASQWPEALTRSMIPSPPNDRPYVIDTFEVPFDNPYRAMMFFTGIDFLSNGDAIISTLMGDLWKVSGLAGNSGRVTWKRFAVGLNLPIGVKVLDDRIYAIGREQLSRLTDLNGDGEADFYENIANDFFGMPKAAPHTYGLDVDPEGAFYYIAGTSVYKTPKDGSPTELIATGLRNCMGYGMDNDGVLLVGPQEGIQTPASMVVQVHDGEFYGHGKEGRADGSDISPPLCYIPRGVDNSIGGFVFNDSDQFGPIENQFLGLSYGLGSYYMILRDTSCERPQGAIVPLQGEFLAGAIRGAFHPKDGQLYVVGLQGWGDYSLQDGCLQRVRYTGKPVYQPIGFAVHGNGIRIDFTTPVDPAVASDPRSYFTQQWEYEYTKGYGSPEYALSDPTQLGHDRVKVTNAVVLDGGKSVFLEMPDIEPVMQMHIRMHLKAASGEFFKTDLFPTIINLGENYSFKGQRDIVADKPRSLTLRTRLEFNLRPDSKGLAGQVNRELTIDAIGGLRYAQEELKATVGDVVALTLVNQDVMPHNFALVAPDAYERVGLAAFQMVNDPKGMEKSYVPDSPDVIANTPLVFPGERVTIYFKAPDEAGKYPYLCTFPGHWEVMKGILIVEEKPLN